MNEKRSGLNAVQMVVGAVVLVALVVGGLYMFSDVWRTKIRGQAEQFAHWTPENIAKDPENYLNFCEDQTKQAVMDLKASDISIARSKATLDSMMTDAKKACDLGDKVLPELKATYEQADKDNKWPAKWQGNEYDKDTLKRQIVRVYNETSAKKKLMATVDSGIKKLDAQKARVDKAKDDAQTQLTDIKANRELVKVQKITDKLATQLVDMKTALQSTMAVASDSKTETKSLDDLVAGQASKVDDADFNKIMGK